MDFKIENQNISINRTVYTDMGLIVDIEKKQENAMFITPYDKNRHIQVVENDDEEHLTVWEKSEGRIIGFIILAGTNNSNLSLELRRIVIQSKGKGFGRQCLQLIKEYCFTNMRFHRLWLDVFEDNDRAINLYKSEGFRVEGHLRDVIKQDCKYRSLILLSILEKEYKELLNSDC